MRYYLKWVIHKIPLIYLYIVYINAFNETYFVVIWKCFLDLIFYPFAENVSFLGYGFVFLKAFAIDLFFIVVFCGLFITLPKVYNHIFPLERKGESRSER